MKSVGVIVGKMSQAWCPFDDATHRKHKKPVTFSLQSHQHEGQAIYNNHGRTQLNCCLNYRLTAKGLDPLLEDGVCSAHGVKLQKSCWLYHGLSRVCCLRHFLILCDIDSSTAPAG